MQLIMVPGIDGSDARHWQTLWEQKDGADRIAPSSWSAPDLADWTSAISTAVRSREHVVLIAHSLGCLAVAHWLGEPDNAAQGVLMVAPPDPTGVNFPSSAAPTFVDLAPKPLPVPGLVVTSTNDPYCTPDAAQEMSRRWQLPHIDVGPRGHLNTASNLGDWPHGHTLLTTFLATLDPTPTPDTPPNRTAGSALPL
ncbi:RBBP9/YdeN family alpha/beta hydrolase [Nocardia sp. NPDC058705]|uniref:RBBP9/YdeN family alpha/beta hydrolase n=1 Tax=Nocardia sp. NPDC058705 TaxID=3346609 RepID=UPI00369A20C3